MNLRREIKHLREVNSELRKQIQLLEKLVSFQPASSVQVVAAPQPGYDSFRYRGWPVGPVPARCKDGCSYYAAHDGSSLGSGMFALCQKCLQPPETKVYTNDAPEAGRSQ